MRMKITAFVFVIGFLLFWVGEIAYSKIREDYYRAYRNIKYVSKECVTHLDIIDNGSDLEFIGGTRYSSHKPDLELQSHITKVGYYELQESKGSYYLSIELDDIGKQIFQNKLSHPRPLGMSAIVFVNNFCVAKITSDGDPLPPLEWGNSVFLTHNINELIALFPPEYSQQFAP